MWVILVQVRVLCFPSPISISIGPVVVEQHRVRSHCNIHVSSAPVCQSAADTSEGRASSLAVSVAADTVAASVLGMAFAVPATADRAGNSAVAVESAADNYCPSPDNRVGYMIAGSKPWHQSPSATTVNRLTIRSARLSVAV